MPHASGSDITASILKPSGSASRFQKSASEIAAVVLGLNKSASASRIVDFPASPPPRIILRPGSGHHANFSMPRKRLIVNRRIIGDDVVGLLVLIKSTD